MFNNALNDSVGLLTSKPLFLEIVGKKFSAARQKMASFWHFLPLFSETRGSFWDGKTLSMKKRKLSSSCIYLTSLERKKRPSRLNPSQQKFTSLKKKKIDEGKKFSIFLALSALFWVNIFSAYLSLFSSKGKKVWSSSKRISAILLLLSVRLSLYLPASVLQRTPELSKRIRQLQIRLEKKWSRQL